MRDPHDAVTHDSPATPEESDALASFRAALKEANITIPQSMCANGGETGACLRYLRARKLDIKKSTAMLLQTIKWRNENDIESLLSTPLDEDDFRENAQLYPASYHKHDAHGRPVYMERTGSAKFSTLLKRLGQKNFLRMHLRGMEYQYRVLLPNASKKFKKPTTQMCNVIDVGELSLYDTVRHSEVLTALKTIAQVDSDYYPENLGTTLVCNAPWSFTTAWGIISVFLDKKTQVKFKVLGKGQAQLDALCEVLGGIENVPAFLGGECKCPGGCVCLDPTIEPTEQVLTNEQVEYARYFVDVEDVGDAVGDLDIGDTNGDTHGDTVGDGTIAVSPSDDAPQ